MGQIVVVVLGEGVAEFDLAVVDSYVEIMAVVAQKQRCVRAAVDNEVEMPGRGGNYFAAWASAATAGTAVVAPTAELEAQ